MFRFCRVCLQVKAKLAKHFLKLKLAKKLAKTPLCLTDLEPAAAPKAAPKAAAPEVDASPAAPKADSLTAKSSLVGEFVRITDEAMGKYAFGHTCQVISAEGESLLVRAQEAGGLKLGKNMSVNKSQIELLKGLRPTQACKKLQLNYDLRVELDLRFPAEELETGSSFKKDSRCASVHIDMAWWLISRDLELSTESKIVYLRPELTGQLFYQMLQADAAEQFCTACANLKGQVADAELILCPAWGGLADGCEHWTLLTVAKDGTGQWQVRYRDSLSSGPDKDCKEAAQKIVTFLSAALNKDLQFPKELHNKALQPKGSNICGFFVMRWLDADARTQLGEGLSSAGYPELAKWRDRLQALIQQVVKNKGIAHLQAEKASKTKATFELALKKAADLAAEIAADGKFQADVAKKASGLSGKPFAYTGGCTKCAWTKMGSTCCNPDKITAKCKAEELYAKAQGWDKPVDGKFEKLVYKNCLEDIYNVLLTKKGLRSVPSLEKPAGGGDQLEVHTHM